MKRADVDKVLIIGSGPIVIGQACEFDYSGTQACKALRACGYKVVLVNSNPATIMTDPVMADATYIEPLNEARLEQIIEKERPDAILPNLGGQTGLNLSMELAKKGILDKYGVKVIGVNLDAIERGEDREVFKKTMAELGIETPKSGMRRKPQRPMPMAYWPQTTICASASCGNAVETISFALGAAAPRKSVANTMLMRNPGSLRIVSTISGLIVSPMTLNAMSPMTPPITELGM